MTPSPDTRKPIPPVAIVIGVLFFLGLIGLMLFGVMRSGDSQRDALPSPLIGQPAPAFSLPVLHDPAISVSSSELAGAPYVLNVWGSWCPACAAEHAVLSRFALQRSVRVVGYNWKDEPADAKAWLERLGNPYFVVLTDYEGNIALDWGITAAPETFLIDAEGIVRWKHSGALTDAVIEQQLRPLLATYGNADPVAAGHTPAPAPASVQP
ncbi:thiol:disulfide interchange protein [Stenotrophomonas ginsengisoli]|uniref:Thiol:disulfide interchange protein n=1 Tax=Stenotrophomonas ginsengisoli TaxID=336566 RepID=A0A0R0D760_9GAMM|nr:DsbE family thiol:disulfide interchange protein [Stenotrophomonas ginsengisoli]KRG78169.1 thiol:disulfide interchange protein [Stenotrophomonas ginsengisoli]